MTNENYAPVLAVVNNKGGVGKTTTSSILGDILARLGKKVLEIDLDSQSNLSVQYGQYKKDSNAIVQGRALPDQDDYNIAELLQYRFNTAEEILPLIKPTNIENLYIIPSSNRHGKTVIKLQAESERNNNIILKRALETIKDQFDFIIIDNAPASDLLTVNALYAADKIIVPVRVEDFSYKGFVETLDSVRNIKEEHEIDVEISGVLVTQAERGTISYESRMEKYRKEIGDLLFSTTIRKDVNIYKMQSDEHISLFESKPDSNALRDYCNLILEMGILDKKTENKLKLALKGE